MARLATARQSNLLWQRGSTQNRLNQ